MSDANNPNLMSNEDFQFVLGALLKAYQPILENELKLARSAQTLIQESQKQPPTCARRRPPGLRKCGSVVVVLSPHPLLSDLRLAGVPRAAHLPRLCVLSEPILALRAAGARPSGFESAHRR